MPAVTGCFANPFRRPLLTRAFLLSILVELSSSWSGLSLSTPNDTPLLDSNRSCPDLLQLDVPRLRQSIASGGVYQQFDFLSEEEVRDLLEEVKKLEQEGHFVASGLSNTAKGTSQAFGRTDRSTCVVPWWNDSLENVPTNNPVAHKLQTLRTTLSQVLQRPFPANLAHECYYSQSKVGSYLPRHMDERHEELKGAKGWLLPSRRSISWLVYLSDPEWDLEQSGGALTAFPQKQPPVGASTHNGNLQIGWLLHQQSSQAVYLDSWFKVKDNSNDVPHCILYIVHADNQIEYISRPFLSDAIQGMSIADFLKQASLGDSSLFVTPSFASKFALLEDRPAWDQGEVPEGSESIHICPTRASLVLFDSVTVPHQVEMIKQGTRMALAGWFHEETQSFPEGFYSESS